MTEAELGSCLADLAKARDLGSDEASRLPTDEDGVKWAATLAAAAALLPGGDWPRCGGARGGGGGEREGMGGRLSW